MWKLLTTEFCHEVNFLSKQGSSCLMINVPRINKRTVQMKIKQEWACTCVEHCREDEGTRVHQGP